MVKSVISIILVIVIMLTMAISVFSQEPSYQMELEAKSAVLMDANTGTVLYSKNMYESLPPASVTKIMTLLLVFEAIEKGALNYNDVLTVSEYASSMGGSQVYLEPGENMTVDELLKCVLVASANDAAVTLAEAISGSEEAFVSQMNKRANELGMKNTHFENTTGLDDDAISHLTSAYDIAIMSRELLKYKKVTEYSTIWMDTIRNGEFGLSNTNRLVRFYKGITGLKTGSTSKAGFCVSASAKRENLHLIAVIMGAETSQIRNNCATKLLDYGFANYEIFKSKKLNINEIKVLSGEKDILEIKNEQVEILIKKGNASRIETEVQMDDFVRAPIKSGDEVGKIIYRINGENIGEESILASENIYKISFFEFFEKILKNFFTK